MVPSTAEVAATTGTAAPPVESASQTEQVEDAGASTGGAASPTTPPPSAAPTSAAPTSAGGTEVDAYPEDSIAYARSFLAAWAAQEDSTVADMAVDVVVHGTQSWAAPTGYGQAWSCEMDYLGARWAGHDLVMVTHPDLASTDLVVRRSALGGSDAVVGIDHTFVPGRAAGYGRPETVLDAYARQFVEAWTSGDLATMTRLSDEQLATDLLRRYPAEAGRAPVWAGFQVVEGEPFYLAVDVATGGEEHDFRDIIGMDVDTVLADEPHGVVDKNVVVDPIYSGVCGGDLAPVVTDPAP